MPNRFAVAWYEVPAGCQTGAWWFETFEVARQGTRARTLSLSCLGASPSRGGTMLRTHLQQLIGVVAGVNPASVAIAAQGQPVAAVHEVAHG